MVTFVGPPADSVRNQPISEELKQVLERAALTAGIDIIVINSGGQPSKAAGGHRTGSTRHDNGRAADIQLIQKNRVLTFSDRTADPAVVAFITAAAASGATGMGAGVAYMGDRTVHVGFGTTPQDRRRLVWGARGQSANAPAWLIAAADNGWRQATAGALTDAAQDAKAASYIVTARHGARLRGGPGVDFTILKTLPAGTEVQVLDFDASHPPWARVSVEADQFADGYILSSFLSRS